MKFFSFLVLCLAVTSAEAMWPYWVKQHHKTKDSAIIIEKFSATFDAPQPSFIQSTEPGNEGLFAIGEDGKKIKLVEPAIEGKEKERILKSYHQFIGKCRNGYIWEVEGIRYVVIGYGAQTKQVYQIDLVYNEKYFSDPTE